MGNYTSFIFLFLATFVIRNSLGIQSCPENIQQICDCLYYPFFTIRCSHKTLKEYPDFSKVQNAVEKLDVSYNDLSKFPPRLLNFFALDTLDLSHNCIEFISHDVILPDNIRHLILSHNNISDWNNLNANTFLESASNLETLNLAGNPLGTFNGNSDSLLLISGSLKKLDLSNCQIHKITSVMLNGLISLEHLILSSNPLYTLPDLRADKLTSLDVSDCKLAMLRRGVFAQMPLLTFVNFSGNHRLSLVQRNEEFVESESLRQIDLSKCNMNAVELKGFPNLTMANLNGNLITELTDNIFKNNVLIENLDLSSNAISRITVKAFQWLKRIRSVDLSLNMIRYIERETFEHNSQLGSINLSRNFMARLKQFTSQSLTFLNMSRCEITKIDADAIDGFPEIIELDLSYNWFNELPHGFGSSFLQIFDLSRCRLSSIENRTFSTFPELSRLNLAGNRLTTTFRKEYFANNQYLNEIWLGDNPWRCECDKKSSEFYQYLTDRPPRLKDHSQLRCYSAENADGVHWEAACLEHWDPTARRISTFEKLWTMAMALLLVLAILYSAVYGLRWWSQYRKGAREEEQRHANLETTRELMRNNQLVLEQESQLNAPDPRESNPPCYADAILMQKPESFTSLKFGSGDLDSSSRRATKRSRSEEQLDMVHDPLNKSQRLILSAKTRKNQIQKWITKTPNTEASISGLTAKDSIVINDKKQKSTEMIGQLETENGNSPYSQRKPQPIHETLCIQSSVESLNEPIYANGAYAHESIYANEVSIAAQNLYRNGASQHDNETPQTSQSLYASNDASFSTSFTSSTSSFDSDNDYYLRLSHYQHQTSKQSDV